MSTGARLGILAGIIVVAVVALVIMSGGDDSDNTSATTAATATAQAPSTGTSTSTTTTGTQAAPAGPPVFTVTVKNAKPAGGVEKIKVKKGDVVRLVVTSDVADGIHIHGYDLEKEVEAGGTARFRFPAKIDGSFEIELENRGVEIATLTVEP